MTETLPKRTNSKPEAHYRAPAGMPQLYVCFTDDAGDNDDLIAALNDPEVRAGRGYIKLSSEYYIGYMWHDGERWQVRKWRHYSPNEDSYRSVFEAWRDLRYGAAPDELKPDS